MISTARPTSRRVAFGLALASLAVLAGCGTRQSSTDSFLGLITPYRIDIVQGNAVTKEQVGLVRPGMSREQVRAILGSPMLTDPFHGNRWDYVFSLRRPGTDVQRRHVVAWFEGNTLKKIDAPADLPSENEFVAALVPVRKGPVPSLELTEEQRKAIPAPVRRETAAAAEPSGPARSYPPLESR